MPRKSKLKAKYRPAADLDQISADLGSAERTRALLYREPDEDLPGGGQYYCVTCARHLTDRQALLEHRRGKPHKQRLRDLAEPAYTQAEADASAGVGVYKRPGGKRPVAEPLKPELGLAPPPLVPPAVGDAACGQPPPAKVGRLQAEPEAMRTDSRHL